MGPEAHHRPAWVFMPQEVSRRSSVGVGFGEKHRHQMGSLLVPSLGQRMQGAGLLVAEVRYPFELPPWLPPAEWNVTWALTSKWL